jgi:hypothetical protein
MKANELRIGNMVEIGSGFPRALTLQDFQSQFFEQELGRNIRPIPLTKEWTQRLGLEQIPFNDALRLPNCKSYLIKWLHLDSNTFVLGMQSELGNQEVISELEIKYVHQLQNLYFALTGEELTLQPQVNGPKPYPMSDEG